ncbi:MAG TPA: hypothetical protein VLY04_08490 [Bryobacteraceae bacterium]|nr:hypothetical protein [Bryobacteraceae bacterium]
MRAYSAFVVWVICALFPVRAQDQPPAAPPIAPIPPTLENTGKPLLLPFQCTMDDIQWAGLSCSEDEPCPLYLELSAVTSVGDKFFAAGNIHFSSVTLYSVLLGSEDAGHTWRELHERIRGAGLDHLQFLDAETGWAGGEQLSPLPRDPFLLLTTDGGKTWRQQSILSDSAENHFGFILQFFFSDKESGSLVIDHGQGTEVGRYGLYESPNAGDTWVIKEESTKPLVIKNAPLASGDWRVRADAASKSFHLEHRQGERWISKTAFAVNLGVCKPPQ